MLPTYPLDLGRWAHLPRRGPRYDQLISFALASPGRIYAVVRYAEGPCAYGDRLESLPPMPVEELLPHLNVASWRTPADLGYEKHGVLRAQVNDGVLRVSDIKVCLTGDPVKDNREKACLLENITPSPAWLLRLKETA